MTDLNTFLGGEDAQPAAVVPAVEESAGAATETAASVAEPDPKAAPAAEPADEVPEDAKGLIQALHATRRERADHKGRADRVEGELAAVKAQLEAALKAPPAAPVAAPEPAARPEPVAIPSPVEDPEGFTLYQERMRFNDRLNWSQAQLVREGVTDLDAMLDVFKKAAEANPAMRVQLSREIDPLRWAYNEAKRITAMEEIGPDPTAWRAKIEAEVRAKIAAEAAAAGGDAGGAPSGVEVVLPSSLGTVRSASPRLQAVTPAPSFDDIFARRKRA